MEHFKTVCSCGAVIAQCRCPSKDKSVTVIQNGCTNCKDKKGTDAMIRKIQIEISDDEIETLKQEAARCRREARELGLPNQRFTWRDAARAALAEGIADAEIRLSDEWPIHSHATTFSLWTAHPRIYRMSAATHATAMLATTGRSTFAE